MTVCIAGIHEDREGSSIILVCDRRISLFGGWFSQDGNAKYTPVHGIGSACLQGVPKKQT